MRFGTKGSPNMATVRAEKLFLRMLFGEDKKANAIKIRRFAWR
jgi:hypothetical protein